MDFRIEQMKHLDSISEAVADFNRDINSAIFEARRAQKEEAAKDLSVFTAEAQIKMRDRAQMTIAGNLKAAIAQARRDLRYSIEPELQQMKEDYNLQLSRLPLKRDILDALRVYRDFNIPLSVAEIAALAADCDGNVIALRCLASLASASGFDVEIPALTDYGKLADDFMKATEKATLPDHVKEPEFTAVEGGAIQAQINAAAFTDIFSKIQNLAEEIQGEGITLTVRGGPHEEASAQKRQTQTREAREAAAAAVHANTKQAVSFAQKLGKDKAQSERTAENAKRAYQIGG